MNIGFDAKRYFHNSTGLGNYSRTLVSGLVHSYPQNEYFLFNPKPSKRYTKEVAPNVHEVQPSGFLYKKLPALWRTKGITEDLKSARVDLYHGLSHEIPVGIDKTGIKSVVTIHDLIFERYPEQYGKLDRRIYRQKFQYACKHADRVIAISQQTAQDLVAIYKIDPSKIDVCYQSCDPAFGQQVSDKAKETIRRKYNLPQQYFLYVGSIIERKNLLTICQALHLLSNELDVPLVVIGAGKGYKEKVKAFIAEKGLGQQVIFLSESPLIDAAFQMPQTFAAIYQMAVAMIYPSFFEGFGIPVLEALWSRIPVITSNVSCMPETGGEAAYYIDPQSADEMAQGMLSIYHDSALRETMTLKGWQHAQRFIVEKCASSVMSVYQKVIHGRNF
ncbi:MAG: hypothetical protein JWP88_737 [Flaviaesturariibacter sp.]|nr:hypothetical protein [Flaviaesturariibacter sp.]